MTGQGTSGAGGSGSADRGAALAGQAEPTRTVALATAFLTALRVVSMYPSDHPRVAAAMAGFVAELKKIANLERWVTLRLRGTGLAVDGAWIEAGDAQLTSLCERMRNASLCGIEFSSACRGSDVQEFAVALTRAVARVGPTQGLAWPKDHPHLRTLDLVFAGHHGDDGIGGVSSAAGVAVGERSAAADARRQRLLACLGGSEELRERLDSIEANCGAHELEEAVEVDLIEAIADLLPAEVASDEIATIEVTGEVLDRVYAEVLRAARTDGKVPRNALLSTAIDVARRYMTVDAPTRVSRAELPMGRPEDEAIEGRIDLLLEEYARLPEWAGVLADSASEELSRHATDGSATNSAFGVELLGIHLHTLAATASVGTDATLPAQFSDLLVTLDPDRLAVLDAYLRPEARDKPTRIGDDATLRVLAVLTRIGRRSLILQRGYCPAGLVRRAFPDSLPIAARILGGTPRGLAVLREALVALGPTLQGERVTAAAAAGILADLDVIRALVGVGGAPPLPLLAAAAVSASPEVLDLLVDYARTLEIGGGGAVVLRWVRLADLPTHYLAKLLAAAATTPFDAKLQALSGTVLRDFIERRRGSLPLEHLLGAIEGLREIPVPATREFLGRLATQGRFTKWGGADRAVRRQARQILATPGLFETAST